MKILNEIANDLAGVSLLHDWLGTGAVPVEHKLAEHRADICRTCTENVEPRWWERVKVQVADIIKAELNIKNSMNVTVSGEDELHMCKICGCCIPLKVHTPITHIKEHTPPNTMKMFPVWCWIKKETK